ncbi:MAG: carbohydrate-binding domain-containing protein [Clostridia bacterium]|nr:carbohydrate-binding domain-containing protein [Clostridia bacterium]
MKSKNTIILTLVLILAVAATGCSVAQGSSVVDSPVNDGQTTSEGILTVVEGSVLDTSEMFMERELDQTPELTDAIQITLVSGQDVTLQDEGTYIISGEVMDSTIIVEADNEAKVQLVLDGISITNEDKPAVYVKSADKVFITSTGSNILEVNGYFTADGETNLDAVIYSKEDLVMNGTGILEITSAKGNGISSKDDVKITGGTYVLNTYADGIEANDSIRIYDGELLITSLKDALHCENEEDDSLGYIYIYGGTLNINASDDAIRGNSIVQIDGGTINIEKCSEGIEATYIQINGGTIDIYATDDGINATAKTNHDVVIEVNGGIINVTMGSGDTDAFDSNGAIYVNGGTIDVSANSAFDADYIAQLNDGTVTVNGERITQITVQMMGGPKRR